MTPSMPGLTRPLRWVSCLADVRTHLHHPPPPHSSTAVSCPTRSFVRRLPQSVWAVVHGRSPAGVSQCPRHHEGRIMKRHNIEFLWGWFDALRRRDTESMAAALDRAIVWQGVRPDLVCHGPDEVIDAFLAGYDANQAIDSLELLGGDDHIVLGVRAPDLAIDEVETAGEIYNVFTIDGQKITRIEDYLEREVALAAASVQPPAGAP